MLEKAVGPKAGKERLLGKVFSSGLSSSLCPFLAPSLSGQSTLSTKLITVQRALSWLVCLFFQPAGSFSSSLSARLFLVCRTRTPPLLYPLAPSRGALPLARSFSGKRNLLPNGVPYGGQVSSARETPLRFGLARFQWRGRAAFSIIGRVLPRPDPSSRVCHLPRHARRKAYVV